MREEMRGGGRRRRRSRGDTMRGGGGGEEEEEEEEGGEEEIRRIAIRQEEMIKSPVFFTYLRSQMRSWDTARAIPIPQVSKCLRMPPHLIARQCAAACPPKELKIEVRRGGGGRRGGSKVGRVNNRREGNNRRGG